ncbi:hypothetical protein CAAN1_20S02674 [[Candida] anglica]|uniref:Long-chain-alcohol oxidase n=1 Tax=[Candida] anglica TaxID=148631 RepID=A0ABP0EI04_9ASCO
MLDLVEEKHIEVALALADGFIHETTPEAVGPWLSPNFPKDRVQEYCNSVTRTSEIPGVKEFMISAINKTPTDAVRMYVVLANVLESRILAPVLTSSLTLIRDMTLEQREELLQSWSMSAIPAKRRLFHLFFSLSMFAFNAFAPELHNQAIGYPGTELRDILYESQVVNDFKFTMLDTPRQAGNELYVPNVDVLIIGSGSGAGVVAHTLTEQGHKCLVLEKGKYYTKKELEFNDLQGLENLYENGGILASADQSVTVLAGSTFGGGSTVNWSASLKTPFKVRKEWYDDFGIDWAASESYENATDYVLRQMGASTENIKHSFSNQVLLDGAKKLGYASKEVPQNSGNHANHSCGMCHLGCKFGVKQGSVECWFRAAAETGNVQFMSEVKVVRLIHKAGKCVGVVCKDVRDNSSGEFTITGPSKYVVCGGALNTPIVLQNSGFRNKHIGANLKLHPVTVLFGDFGKDLQSNPHQEAILTSVCTESDDIDGLAHGAKIETILHTPLLESVFLPWNSSDSARTRLLKYQNLASMLIITRDTSSGKLSISPEKPDSLIVDYSVNKFDRKALQESILIAADILYIEGALEIIHPQIGVKSFKSNKPKANRTINDEDFATWRAEIAKITLQPYSTTFGSAHQMSSCRIAGKGPKYGACDNRGRLYECDNVYVADASAMPTASGVNPMISVMAIARVIALGIAKELQPSAKL